MTPKEKADDLYQMYYESLWHQDEQSRIQNAKEGSLIAINEILDALCEYHLDSEWWHEVKHELNKSE